MENQEIKIVRDIIGTELKVGDEVYYASARKNRFHHHHSATGELKLLKITKILPNGKVSMGPYRSKSPSNQLLKIETNSPELQYQRNADLRQSITTLQNYLFNITDFEEVKNLRKRILELINQIK